MEPRLNFFTSPTGQKTSKHLNAAGLAVNEASLPATTLELIRIRASQLNGCAYCLDMHTKDATAAGEDTTRLHLVACWREATVYTEAERSALELTEQLTLVADHPGGITESAWAAAAIHHDDEQLAALVSAIAVISAFNRVAIAIKQPAGHYQPGTLAPA